MSTITVTKGLTEVTEESEGKTTLREILDKNNIGYSDRALGFTQSGEELPLDALVEDHVEEVQVRDRTVPKHG